MRIQIDTDLHTIKIESTTNLKRFFDFITKVLENWEIYAIEANTTIVWQNPIYVNYPYTQPYWTLISTGTGDTGALSTTSGNPNTFTTNSRNEMSTLLDGHDKTSQDEQKLYIKRNMKGTYNLEVN